MKKFNPHELSSYIVKKRIKSANIWEESIDAFGYEGFDLRMRYCTIIGNFFEYLTQAIFGGVRHYDNGDTEFCPDLVIDNHRAIEVKACAQNRQVKFSLFQLEKYNKSSYDTYYCICKYMMEYPLKHFINKKVFPILAVNVGFMILMPIVLLNQLRESGNEYILFYDNPLWGEYMKLSSRGINELLAFPGKTIRTMGLQSSRYRFIKRRLPDEVKINDNAIKPFPILIIRDRWRVPF